jgi:predicted 2-oxoglutarate/Fe(II)-dependent dioxygenase YbiX
MQFTIYKKGQYYNWHSDCGIKLDKDGQIRKLSASIILNDPSEFEGRRIRILSLYKTK